MINHGSSLDKENAMRSSYDLNVKGFSFLCLLYLMLNLYSLIGDFVENNFFGYKFSKY